MQRSVHMRVAGMGALLMAKHSRAKSVQTESTPVSSGRHESDTAEPPANRASDTSGGYHINRLLIRQTVIEENERRRIGRALHDGVLQDLARIRSSLSSGSSGSTPTPAANLTAQVDGVIQNLRTLMFELSPPILEDLGLYPALEWLSDHLRDRHHARVELQLTGDEPELSSTASTIIFRSVREFTLNAVKHAPGATIGIACEATPKLFRVTVFDDGPGFDTRPTFETLQSMTTQQSGFGLISVEQQINGIHGDCFIDSSPGHGTRATIEIPIEQPQDTAHA